MEQTDVEDHRSSADKLSLDRLFDLLLLNSTTRKVQKVGRRWSPVVEYGALSLICLLCFGVRQFAVIRYESVIHEFDPYFNFRTTQFLSREGFYEFWNWFDESSWYPLGRVTGQTLYPGLMTTSKVVYELLHMIGLVIDIKDVCVFLAPLFSALTAIAVYLFTKEATSSGGAGLFAALFLGLSPAYLSRSVAGSYDNEAVAIFGLVMSFYTWIRSIRLGTMMSAFVAAVATFYMVVSWGGYIFVINSIAVYMVAMALLRRLTARHLVTYNTYYVLITMLCLNVPFVKFSAVRSAEHMSSHGVFLMVNILALAQYGERLIPRKMMKRLMRLFIGVAVVSFLSVFLFLVLSGRASWSGRSMTLLDPTYAAKYIPIIASVSEHQPPIWSSYFFDLHLTSILLPLGIWVALSRSSDQLFFVGLYGVLAVYFAGVMVRLMLVLAPAAAVLSAIGLSHFVSYVIANIRFPTSVARAFKKRRLGLFQERQDISTSIACFFIVFVGVFCVLYICHCVWASSVAYSHPTVILSSRDTTGKRIIQDDFREAYYWLRQNTHPKSKVMSWWDYGYQALTMSNRTTLVDNNTWNNTHIATVGLAFASPEEEAYRILDGLDVDYVFVLFGGFARYMGDDLNKFLWMVRIASGVYPHVQQSNFLSNRGQPAVTQEASEAMRNSLMYKLSYHQFAEATRGYDQARGVTIGYPSISLKYFQEVYTTENWLVRIYKMVKRDNRGKSRRSIK